MTYLMNILCRQEKEAEGTQGANDAHRSLWALHAIQTPAEGALSWQLYQDPACKNRDGSDNFLVMAGTFNQKWSTQVSCSPERTIHRWLT